MTVKSYDTRRPSSNWFMQFPAALGPPWSVCRMVLATKKASPVVVGPTPCDRRNHYNACLHARHRPTSRWTKPDYSIGLSRWHPAVSSVAFAAAQTALADAGFSVTIYPDAAAMKWTKLLMNMVGNATCAILDMPPNEIFADTSLADLEIEAWREALAVMKAQPDPPRKLRQLPL